MSELPFDKVADCETERGLLIKKEALTQVFYHIFKFFRSVFSLCSTSFQRSFLGYYHE